MAKPITKCRSCSSKKLVEFLDLGEQRLSDFREDTSLTPRYPLRLVFCETCKLVQLRHTVPQGMMYHNNYGFKSGISETIKADLKDNVKAALKYIPNPTKWLDIASNDGTLLSFVPTTTYRVGVDPVEFLCKEAERHADRIINDFFSTEPFHSYSPGDGRSEWDQFDVITSVSCFYDMPDPNKFVTDVKQVLADDGVWVIQQNYLLTTIHLNAVDNICHEHLEYYTLMSLESLLDRHDLEVFHLTTSEINGGSIRTFVCRKGKRPINASVSHQRALELYDRLDTVNPYQNYAIRVWGELFKLRDLLVHIRDLGQVCYILAASTRGATIWQAAKLTNSLAPYAIEKNPAKVGKYFSAVGDPPLGIISEAQAADNPPHYKLVGPWFYGKEIAKREKPYLERGGQLIMPLPELKVININNLKEYLES